MFKGFRYGAPTGVPTDSVLRARRRRGAGRLTPFEFGSCAPQRLSGQGFRNPAAPSVVAPGLALLNEIAFLHGAEAQSEDCLFLNVWTRDIDRARSRPVMVWLHGGGFNAGAGSSPVCGGSSLVRRGDVVVVSLNHRLGALGFAISSRCREKRLKGRRTWACSTSCSRSSGCGTTSPDSVEILAESPCSGSRAVDGRSLRYSACEALRGCFSGR